MAVDGAVVAVDGAVVAAYGCSLSGSWGYFADLTGSSEGYYAEEHSGPVGCGPLLEV